MHGAPTARRPNDMPLVGQTSIQADLKRRVADVGNAFESGIHAVNDGWGRAIDAITSIGRHPDERAKRALRGWFTATDGTGSVLPGSAVSSATTSQVIPADVSASGSTSGPPRRLFARKRSNGSNRRSAKEELGTSTWVFLHTLAAQYPDKPSTRQKRDVKNLIDIMTRLYPCGECAEHFQEIVRVHPPHVESREALSRWMCDVHNVVNRSLGKPVFNCSLVSGRWQSLDGDGSCGDERGCRLRTY